MARNPNPNYFWRVMISIDQFFNTLTGGDEDETISSRIGKAVENREDCWICHTLCKILHFIDSNHCQNAIERDEGLDK